MDQHPLLISVANRFIGSPVIYDFPTNIVHAIYKSTVHIICSNSLIILNLITLITLYYHQHILLVLQT